MMENVVMDKIKISLLFFVFFLAFLFSKTTEDGDFVPLKNTVTDIVDNKSHLVDGNPVFVVNKERNKT
ncbi:MAG: hypothetical protein ACRCZ9_01305 [Fusobacteriaceae bacterium]